MAFTHHDSPVRYSGKGSTYKMRKEMPMGLDTDFMVLMDDFNRVAVDTTNDWTVVKDTGASVSIAADTVNGELNLNSAATTDDDGASIQGNEVFALDADRNIWFETRIKNSHAANNDMCVGLTVNFATNPEAMLTAADRIVFQVDDGDRSILCKTEKDGTETSTDSGEDLSNDTYVKLAILVEGTGRVVFFVNDREVAVHGTNIPDDENLTVAAMSLSGNATGTHVTTLDYILAAQTR